MEFSGHFSGSTVILITKRRSAACRKPRADPHLLLNDFAIPTLVTPPSSDDSAQLSLKNGSSNPNNGGKMDNIKLGALKNLLINGSKNDNRHSGEQNRKHGSGRLNVLLGSSNQKNQRPELKRCTEVVTDPSSRKNTHDLKENSGSKSVSVVNRSSFDNAVTPGLHQPSEYSNQLVNSKLRKVKLKVGGITHTLKSMTGVDPATSGFDNPGQKLEPICQDDLSQRVNRFVSQRNDNTKECEAVRKSKRIPKRQTVDEDFYDDINTKEIMHLSRFKSSKFTLGNSLKDTNNVNGETSKNKKNLNVKKRKAGYDVDDEYSLSTSKKSRDGYKFKLDMEFEDAASILYGERGSTIDSEDNKIDLETVDSNSGKTEFSVMTRRRALQSCREGVDGNGSGLIDFPNGLPSPPPRKQKIQLSEVERQLKKAEAAKRRKMQVEKAAKESEADAIRKILGQDSGKKKREDKLRQKLQQLSQERDVNFSTLAPNCVRWVMGPTGTTVTFSADVGLPSIFNSKPCSYPPPREKCAGPSCNNPYKYRDSKMNLPLCSLQCYRSVQENNQQLVI